MNNVRTVSDAKRSFYSLHTRPITSIHRRVVEELLVETHLLSVNVDFSYDPIFGFGVVYSFDRFMKGYRPDADRDSIFTALCQAVQGDAQTYRQDAKVLGEWVTGQSLEDVVYKLTHPDALAEMPSLQTLVTHLVNQDAFKYSRLFTIGLTNLLELADPDLPNDNDRQDKVLSQLCDALHLPLDKLKKDVALYRSNLEKMVQAQQVLDDIIKADRKKKEKRDAEAAGGAPTPAESPAPDSAESGSPSS